MGNNCCCRIVDMRCKEVINVKDGARLGFVEDIEVDTCSGRVVAIVVPGRLKFFGILGREDDIVIPWQDICKIGEDIILISFDIPLCVNRERRCFWK